MGLKRSSKKDYAGHRYTMSNAQRPESVDWAREGRGDAG